VVGIAVTIVGVVVLTSPERMDWSVRSFRGDLLTLGNALSYSLFLVLGKPVLVRERTLPATAFLLSFGALWLLPVGGLSVLSLRPGRLSTTAWLLGAFIVVGPTIGAYLLNNYALRRVEPSLVAFFIYLQPLVGAGISIALGVERPTVRLFAAAAIVFTGVYLTIRGAPSAAGEGDRPREDRPESMGRRSK
jgi:drug/metabolite transporter (DMT)-like permease